jgi:uncharacterized repeat protein (TIGR02543 family)
LSLSTPLALNIERATAVTPSGSDYAYDKEFSVSKNRIWANSQVIPSGASDSLTIETWLKIESYTTDWMAIAVQNQNDTTSSNRLWFGIYGPGKYFHVGTQLATIDSGTLDTAIPLNTWTHVALTLTANGTNNAKIYINGDLFFQASLSRSSTSNWSGFSLGTNTDGGHRFDGVMDNVKIWSTTLSAEQLRASRYAYGATGVPSAPSLRAFYDFDEGSGSTVTDRSGSGYDLTISNSSGTSQDLYVSSTRPKAITYDNQGATTSEVGGSSTFNNGSTISSIPTTPPLRTSYVFSGWFTASSGGTQIVIGSTMPNTRDGTVTLYAQWKASQTITFDPLPPRTLGMGPFALSASASSGLAVSFASSNGSICSVSDTTLALVSAGTCTITASQAGNTNYDSATSISRSFLISSSLLITTPSSGLSATYDAAYSLSLSTSGGSGGNTFALASGSLPPGLSLNTSSGVISGTPTSAGSSSLAIRVTDSNTATATTSSFTIAVEKVDPLLSSFTLPTKTYGDAPFTVTDPSVTGSIPGSFTYLSDSASVATILGNSVTITGAGSATLTALFTPTDTENYETATITALLTVSQASQSPLTITSTTVSYGDDLTLTTSGGSGTGALTFVVNTGNCSITNATLTSTSTGMCSVTANKASDSNYLAESTTATITVTTGSATATIAFSSTTLTFGISNPITVTVSTAGSVRFSANGRVIKNCKSITTITSGTITATCNYRPATRRPLTITARLTPTDLNIAPRTSTSAQFLVQRRTGVRS